MPLIKLKSQRELAIMREAGAIVAGCHAVLKDYIKPGISTAELDQVAENFLRQKGAAPSFKGYRGFPASICTSINEVVCHGIPGTQRLKPGDIISIDIGAYYKGYHGDSAWTYAVEPVDPKVAHLMAVGEESLYAGIAQAVDGNRMGDLAHAVQVTAERHGYGVVRDFVGHGIGRDLHEAPEVFHAGEPNTGIRLTEGMVICIEPMITLGDWRVTVDSDGWTVRTADGSISVQFEHTVAITAHGPEILTKLPED